MLQPGHHHHHHHQQQQHHHHAPEQFRLKRSGRCSRLEESLPIVPRCLLSLFAMAGDGKQAAGASAKSDGASAGQPAASKSVASAAQPASTLKNGQSLNMLLSKQSAKIGEFKVIVFKPWKDAFTYEWEGQRRETTAWRCMLVSAADPSLYCMGEFKLNAKNKSAYETHEIANKHGTTLVMSNVALVDNAKTQYNSCSVRVTVNMAMTKRATVFGSTSAAQPVPKTSVAETKQVRVNQNFDLTACALSRGPARSGGAGRNAFDLELADGSTDEASGKVQTMSLAVFASEAEAESLLEFADSCIKQQIRMFSTPPRLARDSS